MSAPPQAAGEEKPYAGEKVMLQGTGKWWSGALCRATIVDVRPEDSTVKVQYADGGFKRFPKHEFDQLRVGQDFGDGHLAFGTGTYEWTDDVLSHITGETESEVSKLREDLKQAVVGRDFLKADKLKSSIQELQKDLNEEQLIKRDLVAAIQKDDFKEAHKIQQRLDAIRKRSTAAPTKPHESLSDIVSKSFKRALGGGLAGASAMVIQVCALMWMRTTMNYQYRYGTGTREAMRILYADGGIPRFYKGIAPALLQGPLSRFGDTAANVGMLALLDSYSYTKDLPPAVKTLGASAAAATWRIFLMPIDTLKTIMQVEGGSGRAKLMAKARVNGPTVFYHGALGASAATFAGHYPWFATYNTLDSRIPVPQEMHYRLLRNASMGFCASVVSDTVSNSLRVLKTYRQTATEKISYADAARSIVEKDGLAGLFGRGLQTRIATNGMQGMLFSVMWKYFDSVIKNYL
eukprot:gene11908-18365_t